MWTSQSTNYRGCHLYKSPFVFDTVSIERINSPPPKKIYKIKNAPSHLCENLRMLLERPPVCLRLTIFWLHSSYCGGRWCLFCSWIWATFASLLRFLTWVTGMRVSITTPCSLFSFSPVWTVKGTDWTRSCDISPSFWVSSLWQTLWNTWRIWQSEHWICWTCGVLIGQSGRLALEEEASHGPEVWVTSVDFDINRGQ